MSIPRVGGMIGAVAAMGLVLLIAVGLVWAFGTVAAWGRAPAWLLPATGVLIAMAALAVAWRSARARGAATKGGVARGFLKSAVIAILLVLGGLGLYLLLALTLLP